ncbi:hypothetical protein PRUPE_3G158000 [Prunus persica]|uniref:Uncharacterized protein n=1 Tax=Prunus persica TaxID=3760 RepID=A0A251Q0Y4_PRUPE|nr:hypothetical protein PRUPE_3G158000 [Prunus persica]
MQNCWGFKLGLNITDTQKVRWSQFSTSETSQLSWLFPTIMLIPSKSLQISVQSLQISCCNNVEFFGYESDRNLMIKSKKSIVDKIGIGSSDIGLLECSSSRTGFFNLCISISIICFVCCCFCVCFGMKSSFYLLSTNRNWVSNIGHTIVKCQSEIGYRTW